jgi:outer membrane receptor protein involved in Fe transport
LPIGEDAMKKLISFIALTTLSVTSINLFSAEEEERERGGIEEITVTAEKRQSTVSDTSMSISAFDTSLIEDLGMQNANDLMDQLPATTRDEYDVRIRGVGRNFRALGGDPGVSTYYNGIYSPDFGIAAGESYLFDLERIEVLRGPQGTLYGRNSIGGAINYITKKPTFESEAIVRFLIGSDGRKQNYIVSSGPITDKLAYRLTGMTADSDGLQNGVGSGVDTNATDDENYAISFLWNVTDDITFNIRGNERLLDNVDQSAVLINQGWGKNRGTNSTDQAVYGIKRVGAAYPGAQSFTHPTTGEVRYGASLVPGVDRNQSVLSFWNPEFGSDGSESILGTFNTKVNSEDDCTKFPYAGNQSCQNVYFEHHGIQSDVTWDVNDTTQVKYAYGLVDFDYTYNQDEDLSDATFSQRKRTVLEDVHMNTHELTVNWMLTPDVEVTSGVFYMEESRKQTYSINNPIPQVLNAADYGLLDAPVGFLGGASVMFFLGALSTNVNGVEHGTAPMDDVISGRWAGNAEGRIYEYNNEVLNESTAVYTQGTWTINDEYAVTFGIRHAEDKKAALERSGGYAELNLDFATAWMPGILAGAGTLGPYLESLGALPDSGQTNLSLINLMMGNATYTGAAGVAANGSNIAPVCEITAETCANPLRLNQGLPYSYTRSIDGNDEWSDTNVRVNLDYTPNDNQLWYFSFTSGYRAGGYVLGIGGGKDCNRDEFGVCLGGADLELGTYDKEEIDAFEIGYKGLHLDDTLQVFASIYRYDYDGYQDRVNQLDPVRGYGVDQVTNANGITNEGFEMDLIYAASDRLTLSGNYSYTNTEYGEDYIIENLTDPENPAAIWGDFTQIDTVSFVALGDAASLYSFNLKGNQLRGIPQEKFTLRASYEMDSYVGPLWWNVSHSYTGDYSTSGIERALDRMPSRETSNISASWWSQDGDTSVRVFVDNVFDNKTLYALTTFDVTRDFQQEGRINTRRWYGVDVRFNF